MQGLGRLASVRARLWDDEPAGGVPAALLPCCPARLMHRACQPATQGPRPVASFALSLCSAVFLVGPLLLPQTALDMDRDEVGEAEDLVEAYWLQVGRFWLAAGGKVLVVLLLHDCSSPHLRMPLGGCWHGEGWPGCIACADGGAGWGRLRCPHACGCTRLHGPCSFLLSTATASPLPLLLHCHRFSTAAASPLPPRAGRLVSQPSEDPPGKMPAAWLRSGMLFGQATAAWLRGASHFRRQLLIGPIAAAAPVWAALPNASLA